MSATYFSAVPPVKFEGPQSSNQLAYRYYDKDRVVLGKTLEEHLHLII